MSTIDEIKNQLDIVDVISESVKLRRSGKNYTGFCPFHTNTRTPAFVVFPETGTWRCFGECNEGGDIFRYVMKKEGVDFKEALKMLAERAGIQLEPLTPQKKEQNERSEYLRKILEEAVVFFRHQLLNTEEGQKARVYLHEKRGIKPNTEEIWELGYAPNYWDAALNHFKAKGYTVKDIIDSGLLTEKEDGKVYDRFRHRVIFPIRNMNGKMAGFGGRVLNPDDIPKFINSPQSALFDKSAILYGLDKARKAIRTQSQAVIVEGYFDVIVVHQEGFQNVISPMGTALTETQMRLLKRFARRFIMALDPDAAGQKATLRGLEIARGALDHDSDPVFDARGLLHHESRLKADLRVSTLPDDLDPDEIVLHDPSVWQEIIQSAKPIIYHVLDSLISGQDIEDPKTKSEVAAQILPLVKDISNPVERDAYRQYIARTLKVDEQSLMDAALPVRRQRKYRRKSQQPPEKPKRTSIFEIHEFEKINRVEKEILAYLVKNPESKYRIDRFLRSNQLNQLTIEDFSNTENQQIAGVVLASLKQDDLDPLDYITENLALEDYFTQEESPPLPKSEDEEENSEHRVLEETARLVMQLRQISVNQEIKDIRFLQDNREDGSREQKKLILNRILILVKERGLLDRALAKPVTIE
jgi:DNA primase